jgi:hypothetical protein
MKLQDKYPYDSTLLGLNNIFHTIGKKSFYINSDCILATDKIITIGKEYIIFISPTETGIKMIDVVLEDAYYHEGIINLIVQDSRSQEIFTLNHCVDCPGNDCKWVLVDLGYFIDRMNSKAIQDYCGCYSNMDRTNGDSNPKDTEDSLEFEF